VPDRGLISVTNLFADIRSIVAGGGGNIVAGGGGNLIRYVVSNDGAGLIGLDGASLIGLDGSSILGTINISNFSTGQMELLAPQNIGPSVLLGEAIQTTLTNGGAGLRSLSAPSAGDGGKIFDPNGLTVIPRVGVISHNGNALVGLDGASLIGAGGSTLIGTDLAGVVSNDGAGLIGNGGGTFMGANGLKPAPIVAGGGGN